MAIGTQDWDSWVAKGQACLSHAQPRGRTSGPQVGGRPDWTAPAFLPAVKWNLLDLRSDVLPVLNSDGLGTGQQLHPELCFIHRVIEMIMQNYFQTVCKGVSEMQMVFLSRLKSHCPHASLYVSKYPKIGKIPKSDMLLGRGILSI